MNTGIKGFKEITVTKELTAISVGSGDLEVYATPAMIALMEGTASESVKAELEEGQGSVGCGLLGLAYFVMVFADRIAGENGQCSVLWIALVCVMMSVGEMVFSPLGNSFINKLAPAKLLGLLLGTWPVAVFISQFIYPKIYAWTLTQNFGFAYGLLGGIVIVFGVILWFLSGKLDSWAKQE